MRGEDRLSRRGEMDRARSLATYLADVRLMGGGDVEERANEDKLISFASWRALLLRAASFYS